MNAVYMKGGKVCSDFLQKLLPIVYVKQPLWWIEDPRCSSFSAHIFSVTTSLCNCRFQKKLWKHFETSLDRKTLHQMDTLIPS